MRNIAKEVLKEIENLNNEELKEVKNRIDCILLMSNEDKKVDDTRDKMIFYNAVSEVLRNKYQNISVPSYEYVLKSSNKALLNKAYKFVTDFKKEILPDINRTKYQSFLMFCTVLIINMLIDVNAPVNIKTILNNFEKIPGLIDRAYPNYIENKLLHLVF